MVAFNFTFPGETSRVISQIAAFVRAKAAFGGLGEVTSLFSARFCTAGVEAGLRDWGRRGEIIGKVGKRNIGRGIREMREVEAAAALDRNGESRGPARSPSSCGKLDGAR
jgi:hypothetical protein